VRSLFSYLGYGAVGSMSMLLGLRHACAVFSLAARLPRLEEGWQQSHGYSDSAAQNGTRVAHCRL